MIRDYLPIPLIPAAWVLTFATLVYPGLDTYWIQHMNIFITGFLLVFGALSWRKMSGDEVLEVWRNIIAAGFLFTAIGTAGFYISGYEQLMFGSSILYWFLAPAAGFKITAELVEKYEKEYLYMAWSSLAAAIVFLAGYAAGNQVLMATGLVAVASIQTASIVTASRMDKGW